MVSGRRVREIWIIVRTSGKILAAPLVYNVSRNNAAQFLHYKERQNFIYKRNNSSYKQNRTNLHLLFVHHNSE